MARTEARISVAIWDDEEFLALSPLAQRTFMFLLSQRDLSYVGVLPLRERRWAYTAAGLDTDALRDSLEELDNARFVVVDDYAEELLIRSFIRRDEVYRQPQLIRSARDALAMVASCRIRAVLADELRRIASLDGLHAVSREVVEEMLAKVEQAAARVSTNGADPARTLTGTLRAGSNDHGQDLQGKEGNHLGLPSPSPDPLPPDSQKAPSEPSSRATRSATRRGTRIPDDFAVTPAMVEWAQENTPNVDGRRETEKFINYWRAKSGKDATKLDWKATWRNWMLNAAERQPGNGARASPSRHQPRLNNPNANWNEGL